MEMDMDELPAIETEVVRALQILDLYGKHGYNSRAVTPDSLTWAICFIEERKAEGYFDDAIPEVMVAINARLDGAEIRRAMDARNEIRYPTFRAPRPMLRVVGG